MTMTVGQEMARLWPQQKDVDAFYGNPRGKLDHVSVLWERENIVYIEPPFLMTYNGRPCKKIRIHRKCAESLSRVLDDVKRRAEKTAVEVGRPVGGILKTWGASIYAGAYNYRTKRGSSSLSMHAYGCAIDLDPERNAFHDTTPHFAEVRDVLQAFENEGWTWGGHWSGRSCDGMHFQAARL